MDLEKWRSCAEHIFVLTAIIRHRLNYNLPTYVAFIDLEKAFDWVDKTLLFYQLLMNNINGKVYNIIKQMYSVTKACPQLNDIFTEWFDVSCGVKQGDNLSPTLFAYLINTLAICIKGLGKGITMGDDKISILLYADDLVLIGKNENALQAMLLAMNDWSK